MITPREKRGSLVVNEWPLLVSLTTSLLFLMLSQNFFASRFWLAFSFTWLFAVILLSASAVVRHAESLAATLGEPLGTLILTLSVTVIEVMMISSVMFAGKGHPAMARDAAFAVVMIALNGMIGLSLLLGGLRYHEQEYNLQGANAFLAAIVPLLVLTLVLPNFTVSSHGPRFSPFQATFIIVMSLALYGVFLAMQTVRHKEYFMEPRSAATPQSPALGEPSETKVWSPAFHFPMLLVYLGLIVYLSRRIAVPIDYGIDVLRLPPALGGLLVSVLVMSSESLGALRAALANQLQRCVNLLLGSVLANISLTIPAVLTVGLISGQPIILGLPPVELTLLLLTLGVSALTFSNTRSNVLLGAVHLILFVAYLMLIFES